MAYSGLADQALDTDDFEYLRDAIAVAQNFLLLFFDNSELPSRSVAKIALDTDRFVFQPRAAKTRRAPGALT